LQDFSPVHQKAFTQSEHYTTKNGENAQPEFNYLLPPKEMLVYERQGPPVSWDKFNTEAFLVKGRLKEGEDRYASNKFNQAASDAIAMDRSISDSRERS
jgi:polypeptide N-acetylgalactosaminyltransferase